MTDTPRLDKIVALARRRSMPRVPWDRPGADRRERVGDWLKGQGGPAYEKEVRAGLGDVRDLLDPESYEHSGGVTRPRSGQVRSYERVERGREEHVGGYMKQLQNQLAGWRSGAGKIAPDAWGLVGDEARKDLTGYGGSEHGRAVMGHMINAVHAIDSGNKAEAVGHLFTGAMEARDRGLPGPSRELLAHANGLRHDLGMGDIP